MRVDRLAAGLPALADELAVAVAQADWPAVVASMSEVALAGPLAESVSWAMYWQPPDGVGRALAYPEVTEALRPVAHAVTGAPAARWWSTGPDLGAQQYVEPIAGNRAGPALSGATGRLAAWLTAEKADERSAAAGHRIRPRTTAGTGARVTVRSKILCWCAVGMLVSRFGTRLGVDYVVALRRPSLRGGSLGSR